MILRSDYIDGLIAEYEAEKRAHAQRKENRGKQKWDGRSLDPEVRAKLMNLWMQHGCPNKLTIHVREKTAILVNGAVTWLGTPEKLVKRKKIEAELASPDIAISGTLNCERCGTPFVPLRVTGKFCSPRCRKAAHKKRKGAEIYARSELRD